MGKKSSDAEMDKRIHEVYTLIVSCASTQQICHYASEKWQISRRNTERLITRATKILKDEIKRQRRHTFEDHVHMKLDLLHRAYADKDWQLAKEIEKDMAEFFNLYPEKASTLNLQTPHPINFVSLNTVPQRGKKHDPGGRTPTTENN